MEQTRQIRTAISARAIDADKGESGAGVIEGYAVVFGKPSVPLRLGERTLVETVSPQVRIAKPEGGVFSVWSHDMNEPLAREGFGLTLTQDANGLYQRTVLPDTARGRDAYELARLGVITGMSFRFDDESYDWTEIPEDYELPMRGTLTSFGLIEVSPVALPAYPQTTLAARCVAAGCKTRGAHDCGPVRNIKGFPNGERPDRNQNADGGPSNGTAANGEARSEAAQENQRLVAVRKARLDILRLQLQTEA